MTKERGLEGRILWWMHDLSCQIHVVRGEVFDDRRAVSSDSEGHAFVQGRL